VLLKPLEVRPGFGHTLHLDFSGPYPDSGQGERYICAIVDSYSTYCWLYACKYMSAASATQCLLKVVGQVGAFKNLISDRAQAFLGTVMTGFCDLFDITKISTSSYSPRSNSVVERLQKTIIDCLKSTCTEGRPWGSALPFVEIGLRSAPVLGLMVSPFEIVNSGMRMYLPVDVSKLAAFDDKHQTPHDTVKTMRSNLEVMHKIIRTNILENQTDMKTAFDAKVTAYGYVKGGVVLLNDPVEKVGVSGKLRPRWIGPFEIV